MRLGSGRWSVGVVVGLLVMGGALYGWWRHPSLFGRSGGRLVGQIVDDASGAPLAARVAVTDSHDEFVEIDGNPVHVDQLGKRWCYVDGSFSVTLPPGGATVAIRRGIEALPLVESVSGAAGEKPVSKTFRLRRWADLRGKGYVSGDLHVHLPALDDAPLQMRAEDLGALNLLITGGLHLANDGAFKGRPDDRSTPSCQIYVGQEIIEWQLGHLTLAGLTSLVPGYPAPGGTLEYAGSNPQRDILRAARAAREQGGLVSVAHFENLPGAATPVAMALGLLDAVELPTWSDGMQLPAHLMPWEMSGMSTAEFAPMRGVDLYYQYLNAGFRLPIAAGTDKLGEEIPIGSNRTYVATNGQLAFSAWLAGIRAGASFVTNGPILDFEVDGHGSGEVVDFEGSRTVKARATARSILPFTTIEIMRNGRPVAHKLSLVEKNAPVDGLYTMEVETTVALDRSSWLAARAFSNPDITRRLMPRASSVFSHTSPVYFIQEGRRVREEASIAYLQKYVKGLLHWLSTGPVFAREEDRAVVRRDAEDALRFYDSL